MAGLLAQRTEFPFEIIVRDDGSSDGSRTIVENYSRRYPNIFRAILEERNSFKKARAREVLAKSANGQFIAICDGDDSWIDPEKLQHMVGALEQSPSAVMAHHRVLVVENGRVSSTSGTRRRSCRSLTGAELQQGTHSLLPVSIVYRNVPIPDHFAATEFLNYDRYLLSRLGQFGGSIFVDRFSSCYRITSSGIWSGTSRERKSLEARHSFMMISRQYELEGELHLARLWRAKAMEIASSSSESSSNQGSSLD